MNDSYLLDFQEAVVEVNSNFIHYAMTTIEGRRWKMFKPKTKVVFFVEVEGKFYIQIPPPALYFAKWKPTKLPAHK